MAGALPTTPASSEAVPLWKRRPWWVLGGGVIVLAITAVVVALSGGDSTPPSNPTGSGETATVVRDKFVATITESGEVDAKRSTDIRCQVEGQSTIVWVIEEGTAVQKGDKLLELDAADLAESLQSQEMKYKTAKADFDKSDQAYLIAQSTRESDLSEAALTVKFAQMDLRKYIGDDLAARQAQAEGHISAEDLLKDEALGGEALQERRKLETDISLADQEMERAADTVEWTQKLKDKGYVTGSELKADELDLERKKVLLAQAQTALELFLRYEFPKAAEQAYTDWIEAKREYDRVNARTQSELESAKADRDNAEQTLRLEDARFQKAKEQLGHTTLYAPQAGMVVYALGGGGRWSQNITIEPGSTVRHQQNLFKLPDLSEMNVKVKVHESAIKQIRDKAPAYGTVDALPTERLTGTVTKIGVMPDQEDRWLNPGLKTYVTEVTLDRTPPGLKPGMSAQVEILVDSRDNVLQVPVSAVFVDKGFQVVYVKTGGGVETRRVKVGLSNDKAVEIAEGLSGGEEVYLYKPHGAPELAVSAEDARPTLEFKAPEPEAPQATETPTGDTSRKTGHRTPEERKAMRERIDQMTPEERQKAFPRSRGTGDGERPSLPNGAGDRDANSPPDGEHEAGPPPGGDGGPPPGGDAGPPPGGAGGAPPPPSGGAPHP